MAKLFERMNDGDYVSGADWNQLQDKIIELITTHSHNGGDFQGKKISGEVIESKSSLNISSIEVSGEIKAKGNISAPNLKISWGKMKTSGWINDWDKVMDYKVPNGHVMVGLYSKHDNHREDRVWKVYHRSIEIS